MGNANSITITNKNCKHMNLVKLQKNKVDNTLVLDIITAETRSVAPKNRFKLGREHGENLIKFSFVHQLSDLTTDMPTGAEVLHGLRFFSILWIILLNVVSVLSYTSSM